ncbi:alkylation response protein AidB-like acyl-CoA dehydrogenase [Halopolyspora algeriensis]|uniref:Alkylation response protein AidB-like acyl-CoA dehydrogenase n=1 Tax=Halopolyspora algeriensis TaxID=1500506 RepID=A0A368VDC7_9ACTN|nr:acyl-CoA dehydrogenase family protein [Halopolyspora algeriensis]RCW37654.1 alkylation response protein AidB-like acyl-CoA dehydrogenase [Halopolyspora algeriensis]
MTTVGVQQERAVPNTAAEILAAAEAIVPELQARADEIDHNRSLPTDIVELLRATGVFRMGFGEQYGGPALTAVEQTQVVEVLARGNPTAGWCAMVGMDSGLFADYLPESAVREMFPSPDLITAGMLFAAGRADRVPGGYRLSGRWGFGSGILHADWVSAGAVTYTDGQQDLTASGKPNWRIMMVRPSEVRLIDNWYPTGLVGTGSADYEIDDVFVPGEHTFAFGAPTRSGALSAPDVLMRKMPGVALGVARAALDYVREVASSKFNRMLGIRWADDYRVQYTLGECEMDFITMRHGVYRSLQHRWDRLENGASLDDFTPDERIETMLTRRYAFRCASSIVRRLYDLMATSSIYASSPMDRWLRDLETMRQHTVAQDRIAQSAGAYLTGGTPQFELALGIVD